MKVQRYLERIIKREGGVHLTLIDPEKQAPSGAALIAKNSFDAGTDGIMVGGSTRAGGRVLDETVIAIKSAVSLPVILFPAGESGISPHADAIFFMSLLNSKDPYYLTRAQMLGAPMVKNSGIEPIPMGYLLIEPGGTAGRVGKAELIPRTKPDLAVAYALAAQYFGMKYVYLEAGSGARYPVPLTMIRRVRSSTNVHLIVGGGIRTPKAAGDRVKAGADVIVTGTLVERSRGWKKKLELIVKAVKAAGKEK